jgi:hypothetical protein
VIELELPGARVVYTGRAEGDAREPAGLERLAAIAGRPLARGRQVHGTVVRRVAEPEPPVAEGDGQATARGDVAPAVLVADCLPIALAGGEAVAMLHGGWRGLAAGIVEEGVRAARELGGAGPLAAAIGPGARGCCYEVGPEVHAAFGTSGRTLDLAAIAAERLRAAGVGHVEDTGICTICDERFFSYRRHGDEAGRQAGVAWRA